MRYTPRQIKEQYEKLPDALKQALYSADIAEKMFELGKKYGLTMEKIGFMSEEAGLVVLGLTPPRAFASALAERLGIPTDAAEKIALEISHEIFFPLREALKQTHQIEVGEGAMAKNTEVKPPPMPSVQAKPETPKIPESPKTEIPKKMPVALRAVADNMEKEIAPLIGNIRNDTPRGFLLREETERLVAEKQKEQAGIKNYELGMRNGEKTSAAKIESIAPVSSPIPAIPPATEVKATLPISPASKNSIDLRASTPPPPPPPPAIPINPKIPPIDLRPIPPKQQPGTPPSPAPEKTKPYQGYDPYREPIE